MPVPLETSLYLLFRIKIKDIAHPPFIFNPNPFLIYHLQLHPNFTPIPKGMQLPTHIVTVKLSFVHYFLVGDSLGGRGENGKVGFVFFGVSGWVCGGRIGRVGEVVFGVVIIVFYKCKHLG